MKTIGLLGGMSWESTVPYYRLINQRISRRPGALHSAEIVLYRWTRSDNLAHRCTKSPLTC